MNRLEIFYEQLTNAVENGTISEEEARDEWRYAKEEAAREMDNEWED